MLPYLLANFFNVFRCTLNHNWIFLIFNCLQQKQTISFWLVCRSVEIIIGLLSTHSYTKRTISKIYLSHLIKFYLFYHRCISRKHFLLIFGQKLSYIMVLAHHFGRGIKPAISMQLRWSSLSLFGSCLYTSYVKFNGFFWLISSKICCYLTFKKFETLFYVTMSNSKAFLTNSAQKILCFSPF